VRNEVKTSKLVELLHDAVEKLGYRVRIEQGRFRGGDCIHKEEKLVFINRRMGDEERAEILARTLAQHDYNQVFLLPEVRDFVEKFVETKSVESESSPQTTEQ
jgi:hypothetical protein